MLGDTLTIGRLCALAAVLLAGNALAERDCLEMYYGVEGPRDLPGALSCFTREGNDELVAVMLVNGEGVARDAHRAREVYQKAQLDLEALDKAIDAALAGGQPHVDYCKDLMQTTLDMNACGSVELRLADAAGMAEVARLKAGLSALQGVALGKLSTAFDAFERAEGDWVYDLNAEGTIRGPASLGAMQEVRKDFQAQLARVVGARRVAAASDAQLRRVDAQLNALYRASLGGAPETPELAASFRNSSKAAQLAWIRYRDAWAELARLLEVPTLLPEQRAQALRTIITEERVGQLKSDGN